MKVLVDENMSPAIARSLDALFSGEHVVVHIRDKFGTGVKDVDWIGRLSAEGRWIVVSGDRRITRNRAEYLAFRSSRLVGFFLAKGLYKSPVIRQMERLLALWPVIEQQSSLVAGGALFELPMKSTRIKQLKV
ncbi:hypothetical protein [Chelativorans alearense]|uniref:PIN-like domain-containing protein n=1 Tax=Chelativorans alearense TaxID=2681495 RepID=UPI0013D8B57A|nr:hypothetical protein [Chelativorans alearense]